MTSSNDITGDRLVSKPPSKEYQDGWDKLFGKTKEECTIYKDEDDKIVRNVDQRE